MCTAQGSPQMTHPPLPYYPPAWGKDIPLISSEPVSPPVNGMALLGHTSVPDVLNTQVLLAHEPWRREFSAEHLGIANSTFSIASTEGLNSLENFRLILS